MNEHAERAVARQGQKRFLTHAHWKLWFNRRGRLKGIAIVYPASDYGLELQPNGLSEQDRISYCESLCDTLNIAQGKMQP